MKKVFTIVVAVIISQFASSQSVYVAPSIGTFLNADIHKPLDMMGYSVEAGYCFGNEVCLGMNYGTLDLKNKVPFIQVRTGYTFLDRKKFSLSLGAGLGYAFRVNQLIGEGDLNVNIHLPKDVDFVLNFANQVVYGIGYLPSINVGVVKYISVKKKVKK